MFQSKGNVTVIVADLDENGPDGDRQIVVIEYHWGHDEAIKSAKEVIAEGWANNHTLPMSVARVIANAYDYHVEFSRVLGKEDQFDH